MDQPSHILAVGTQVHTHTVLGPTDGIISTHSRRPNVSGTIHGVVPGSGGDAYFVLHEDGAIGSYCWDEFELAQPAPAEVGAPKVLGARHDSWWVHRKTGTRLYVPRRQSAYHTEWDTKRPGTHFKAFGRLPGMVVGIPEGRGLYPLWFQHKDDLRLLYKPMRVPAEKPEFPSWLERILLDDEGIKDLVLQDGDEEVVVSFQDVHSGWACLSAILQSETTQVQQRNSNVSGAGDNVSLRTFDWGNQRYNTFFLRVADAIPRLRPRWGPIPLTVHDRVLEGLDAPDPKPRTSKPTSGSTGRLRILSEDVS